MHLIGLLAFGAIRIRPRGTRLQHRHQPIKLLTMRILFQICTVLVATFCLLQQATAQDPVKQSPDKYKVVLNNDKVRVLDVRLKPGDKSPMHSHPDRLSYVLSGSTVKSTSKEGKTTEVKTKAGQSVWHNAESHAVENTGKTEVRVLEIELKR